VKYLYNKRGSRKGEGEKHPFAFFALGAIGVVAAIFVIGLQVGRVIEKNGTAREETAVKNAATASPGAASSRGTADIRKDLGAFSEDAMKVPVVPPPDAKSDVNEVEKNLTFRDTLAKMEAKPVPLVKPTPKENAARPAQDKARVSPGKTYLVQAGSFRDRKAADAYRARIAKAGFAARVVASEGKNRKDYFRVLLGPFADRESARKAARRLKAEMKVDAFLLAG